MEPTDLSRFLRTDRLVDINSNVSFRFVIPIVFYRFCLIKTKRNEKIRELNEMKRNEYEQASILSETTRNETIHPCPDLNCVEREP